jgi:hypothetical protein
MHIFAYNVPLRILEFLSSVANGRETESILYFRVPRGGRPKKTPKKGAKTPTPIFRGYVGKVWVFEPWKCRNGPEMVSRRY